MTDEFIENNPSNHSKEGEAVDRYLRMRWAIKNIFAFIGCIVLIALLKYQVVTEWNNHPVIVFIASAFGAVIIFFALRSLWRAVSGK